MKFRTRISNPQIRFRHPIEFSRLQSLTVFQHPHSNARLWHGHNLDSDAATRKASTDRWALESTSNPIYHIALLSSQQFLPRSATSRRRHAFLSTNHTTCRYSRLTRSVYNIIVDVNLVLMNNPLAAVQIPKNISLERLDDGLPMATARRVSNIGEAYRTYSMVIDLNLK